MRCGWPDRRCSAKPQRMTNSLSFLDRADRPRLVYSFRRAAPERADAPTLVFLPGYASDMTGTKALALDAWAGAQGLAMLRFDYAGCGASSGAFEDQALADWRDDVLALISNFVVQVHSFNEFAAEWNQSRQAYVDKPCSTVHELLKRYYSVRVELEKVQADKLREVKNGHDGTWVAHPGLVPVAKAIFDEHMPQANQLTHPGVQGEVLAADLLRLPISGQLGARETLITGPKTYGVFFD